MGGGDLRVTRGLQGPQAPRERQVEGELSAQLDSGALLPRWEGLQHPGPRVDLSRFLLPGQSGPSPLWSLPCW